MSIKEQLEREYDQAPEERQLGAKEYKIISKLSPEELAALPDEERAKFFATAKWRAGMRMNKGLVVDGKTIDVLFAEQHKREAFKRAATKAGCFLLAVVATIVFVLFVRFVLLR